MKTILEVVSSSSDGDWARAFNFKDSLGVLVVALILLAISSKSFLVNFDNILSARKSKQMVITDMDVCRIRGREWEVPV